MSEGSPLPHRALDALRRSLAQTPQFLASLGSSPATAEGRSSLDSGGADLEGPSARGLGLSEAARDEGKPKLVVGLFEASSFGFEELYCCGVIGDRVNGKMCVESALTCKIGGHKMKHTVEWDIPQEETEAFFMYTSKSRNAVYYFPNIMGYNLSPAAFTMLRERYLTEERTVEEWTSLFTTLKAHEGGDENNSVREAVNLEKDLERTESALKRPLAPKTPMPPKRLKTEVSPGLESEGWATGDPTTRELMEKLVGLRAEISEAFESSDHTMMKLRSDLGHKPTNWGPANVSHIVDSISKDIEEGRTAVQELGEVMVPFGELYASLSNGDDGKKGQPAEKLFGILNAMQTYAQQVQTGLQSKIAELENKILQIPTTGTQPPLGRSRPSASLPSPTFQGINFQPNQGRNAHQTSGPSNMDKVAISALVDAAVSAKLKAVHERITTVEAMSGGGDITFNGVNDVFRTRQDCVAWCITHGVQEQDVIYFSDAHALLTIGFSDYETASDVMQDESNAAKAGHRSVNIAHLKASFKLGLPAFFGKSSKDDKHAAKDARVLPRILKFADWDDSTGHSGLRHDFHKLVTRTAGVLVKEAQLNLSPIAMLLATQVLTETMVALTQMSTWMTGAVRDLEGRGVEKKVSWPLTSHGVRVIMDRLDTARSIGSCSCSPSEKPGTLLWGLMNGLKKMREFVNEDFAAHSDVSHVLNIYLRDHAVLKGDLEKHKVEINRLIQSKTDKPKK